MKSLTSKFNVVAAVLSLAGAGVAYYTHLMNEANALINSGNVILFGLLAVVLCAATVVLSKNDIVGLVGTLGAIGCNMMVLFTIVSERILMIAGIFSYNSQDTAGWAVFYTIVAAAVVLLVANLVLIVGSFIPNKK